MIARGSMHRLHLVAGLALLPLILVLGRVAWLQTVRGDEFRKRAESQHVLRVWIPPHRGRIEDRNGEPLAYTMFNYSILAEPAKVKNPRKTARTLATALGVSTASIERKLKSRRSQVYIERRVTPMLERRLDLSALPGIRETLELKRVYPQGEGAAHVVGFLDHQTFGVQGIESEFDELLRGHPGWSTELRDGLGNSFVALGRRSKAAVPGHTVTLTLDAALQDVAASALAEAAERLHARGGSLVAVDPSTGEILAMASWPVFNPEGVRDSDRDALRNRVIVDPFEPGSTFKLVAATAALSDKLLKPSTPIHCEDGRYNFGGYTITDHHPYGTLSFRECFAVSSNIAFGKVGKLCGSRLYDVARDFGFGSPTGIGLAGESSGRLRSPDAWSKRSAATLAIGYEILVTPLQMAMAYAAVANDGVLMRPQLVRSVHDPDGKEIFRFHPEAVRRVVDAETAHTLRGFMRSVMTDGTGTQANVSWVEVGGKTGTSEKFADGQYSRSRHYASFIGVAPLEDPKLVCFIMLDEPDKSASFGGSAAAPVFREVLEVYGRLPGATLQPEYASMTVSAPSPRGLEKLMPAESVAGAEPGAYTGTVSPDHGVPDVRGESMRRALQVLYAHGVTATVTGTGTVVRQDPPPGSALGRRVNLYGNQKSPGTAVLASSTDAWKEERKGIPEAGWR